MTGSAGLATTANFTNGVLASHAVTLTETSAGAATITATDTAGGLGTGAETGDSAGFTITNGAATKFVILDPADGTVDALIAVAVELQDQFGNLVTTGADTDKDVTLNASGSATGGGVVDIVAGTGSLDISDQVAETVNLTLTDSAVTGFAVTSAQDVVFEPDVLANFLVESSGGGDIGDQLVNVPFDIQVTARDQFNNTLASGSNAFTGTVDVTGLNGASVVGDPVTTAAFTAGVLGPHSVTIDNSGIGFALRATGNPTGDSNTFRVGPLTMYVDDDWAGAPDGVMATGTAASIIGEDAFATIQGALDNGFPGDTVNVMPGTYDEQLTLSLADVTLTGDPGDGTAGPGASAPTLQATAAPDLANGDVHITAAGVVIEGFILDFDGTDGSRLGYGILVQAADAVIADNEFQLAAGDSGHATVAGIGIDTAISTDMGALHIDLNVFTASASSTSPDVDGSLGVWLNSGGGAGPITVSSNVFSGPLYGGVAINTDNVAVLYNEMTGLAAEPGLGTFGVHIGSDSGNDTLIDVLVAANGISQFGTGVDVFKGGGTGTLGVTIESNFVQDNTEGVYAGDGAVLFVDGNHITGNTTGVIQDGTAATVETSANWWGSTDDAVVAADTSGLVDFTPFLDVGTDTDPVAAGFQPDLSTLNVTALGEQVDGGRIQEGVNLVEGSIVLVHPGTYVNNVAITDMDLTLLSCIDRGHSLHMFGDMVDTIIGMTSLQGGGHAMEGDVRYVSEERVRGAGAG